MPDIRFYHLLTQSQAQALPVLLTKALERGMRVVVKCKDDAEVEYWNDHLWTFAPDSFLPHGSKKDGRPEHQPIWLTAVDENPNEARALFLVQGAQSLAQDGFDLCCEIFDGHSSEALISARAQWAAYKSKGYGVTYWQQNERGGWDQKA